MGLKSITIKNIQIKKEKNRLIVVKTIQIKMIIRRQNRTHTILKSNEKDNDHGYK